MADLEDPGVSAFLWAPSSQYLGARSLHRPSVGCRIGICFPLSQVSPLVLGGVQRPKPSASSRRGVVLERARRGFPREPVRTLDAIHLATAVQFQEAIPDLAVASLDERIRYNAQALAMTVVP